jgi:hypothetical protein
MSWTSTAEVPKRADVKAWTDRICDTALAGRSNAERRSLFKSLLKSAWDFSNWLTHSKTSTYYDAEAAFSSVENALSLFASLVIRYTRGVPETCPKCGSYKLAPQRAVGNETPGATWERPACRRCGWVGDPVQVEGKPSRIPSGPRPPVGDCVIPTVPLRRPARRKQKS